MVHRVPYLRQGIPFAASSIPAISPYLSARLYGWLLTSDAYRHLSMLQSHLTTSTTNIIFQFSIFNFPPLWKNYWVQIYPVGEAWLIKNKVSQRINFTILYFYKILFGFSCIIEIKKLKIGFINSELHHFLNKKMSYDANILCYGHNIIC